MYEPVQKGLQSPLVDPGPVVVWGEGRESTGKTRVVDVRV